MKKTVITALIFSMGAAVCASAREARPMSVEIAMLEQGAAAQPATSQKEESFYDAGTQALNNGEFDKAISAFDEAAKMKGRRAEGALYWKAYALNKAGRGGEALTTIAQLRREYPQSRWLREAGALEMEIKRLRGVETNPQDQQDLELKLLALQSLMDSDDARAIPIIEKLLNGDAPEKLKDKALFVLSQSGKPEAQDVLAKIAMGKDHPDLQGKAIHYLGVEGGQHSEQLLQQVYESTSQASIRKQILQSFMVAGDSARLYDVAVKEKDPDLRKNAIHQLGVMGAREQLKDLYGQTQAADQRIEILNAMGIGGFVDELIEVSRTEQDPSVRKAAIHGLGISGGGKASTALAEMYDSSKDNDTKKQIVEALFINDSAHQLIALARKESDPEMKREIVHRLSIMGNREANDYLMEILNK